MSNFFDSLAPGYRLEGQEFAVSKETIRAFAEVSFDYNPLHLDDNFMEGNFGKTNFGGVIMHGMNNFAVITRLLTDWAYSVNAVHRRLETRWLKPVRPGDTIRPYGTLKAKQVTAKSRWVMIDVEVRNQHDDLVASGEGLVEFPEEVAP